MKKYLRSLFYMVFALNGTLPVAGQTFTDSNLPIIVINTYGNLIDTASITKKMGMGIIDNGPGNRNYLTNPYNNFNGNVLLRLRGSSSLGFPKKSYKVTTIDSIDQDLNVPLLGMPDEHDWVLKGIYPDKTFLRDELSYWLYNQLGRYSSRVRFVELMVNTKYRGIYCLLEKVKRDKNRVDIANLEPWDTTGDNLTGGYIIKLDKFDPGEEGWFSDYSSNSTHDSANYFLYAYPKPDSMPQVQKEYIKNFVDKFENTLASTYWNNPDSGYSKYINVLSFIDNLILNELSRNVDGYRASTYFYKDKDSRGDGKLHAGPAWDYDIAWNNCNYNGGNNPAGWQYKQFATQFYVPFWWWQIMSDTGFTNQLSCRYQELRGTFLNQTKMFAHIDSMAVYLNEAQARNFTKWPILGQYVSPNPSPIPATYPEEISNLKNFISLRLAWLDANMPGVCNSISVPENPVAENNLQTYPNPFAGDLTISYRIPQDGMVKIEVINLIGENMMLLFSGNKTAGSYFEELSMGQLPPGAYVLRLSSVNFVAQKKLVKVGY